MSSSLTLLTLLSLSAWAGQKPVIIYKNPPDDEDARPVITEAVVGPQGTDYALSLEFNKAPWGEVCKTRCANATLFLDTDSDKKTGLRLVDDKAPENGADLAIVVQGPRVLKEGVSRATLTVKVLQFTHEASSAEQGAVLAELDPRNDPERLLSEAKGLYLLIDANLADIPQGKKLRVIYHPPDSKPLSGTARGMATPGASRLEIFKDGVLSNPVRKKKSVYEKLK
jgi:hypothetical protein